MGDLFGAGILNLPYYDFIESSLDGIPLVITRTGWTGEVGYEIFLCDPKRGVELWEKILSTGRPYKIAPIGPSDIRRIEAGILNYGADMTLAENPEVGLGWLVDEKRDAFIGKESLRRIKSQGVRRKLVGVEDLRAAHRVQYDRWPVEPRWWSAT
jgi:aminomethyltransferase